MSHRESCPDRWEARREGERAHDRGYGSFRNPYGGYGESACEEAERAWRSGWYDAERQQEEREAEAAQERAMRRRIDEEAEYERAMIEQAERDEYYARAEEQWPDEPDNADADARRGDEHAEPLPADEPRKQE